MPIEENCLCFLFSNGVDLSSATSKSEQSYRGVLHVENAFLKSVLHGFAYFIGFNVHLLQI